MLMPEFLKYLLLIASRLVKKMPKPTSILVTWLLVTSVVQWGLIGSIRTLLIFPERGSEIDTMDQLIDAIANKDYFWADTNLMHSLVANSNQAKLKKLAAALEIRNEDVVEDIFRPKRGKFLTISTG